jgi:hypothetical protein
MRMFDATMPDKKRTSRSWITRPGSAEKLAVGTLLLFISTLESA